jgi:Fe-S oxidoreductase
VNSLRNDYPQAGGNYKVLHHSQLLAELVEQKRLPAATNNGQGSGAMTYHDPCYLARANGIVAAPRQVLSAASNGQLPIVELPRNKCATSCCGAGGGRMWFDDSLAQRVGQGRVSEIAESGAGTVAVACPFCLVMLSDGLAAQKPEVQVRDIAEVMAESLLGAEAAGASAGGG